MSHPAASSIQAVGTGSPARASRHGEVACGLGLHDVLQRAIFRANQAAKLQSQPERRQGPTNQPSTCQDAALSQVHVGDVVTVVKGAAADRSGTVKYIFRQFLFLHARRVLGRKEGCSAGCA